MRMHFPSTTAALAALVALGLGLVATPLARAQSLTPLFTFACPGSSGCVPEAPLIRATDGNFYGTTFLGGAHWINDVNHAGTVFRITPSGTLTTIYNFCAQGGTACTDGQAPIAGLVQGNDGNLYGTTLYGGVSGEGRFSKSHLGARSQPSTVSAPKRPAQTVQSPTQVLFRVPMGASTEQPRKAGPTASGASLTSRRAAR